MELNIFFISNIQQLWMAIAEILISINYRYLCKNITSNNFIDNYNVRCLRVALCLLATDSRGGPFGRHSPTDHDILQRLHDEGGRARSEAKRLGETAGSHRSNDSQGSKDHAARRGYIRPGHTHRTYYTGKCMYT